MVLVKVLKRKDASSVLVAVALALSVSTFISVVSYDLSARLTKFVSGNESQYLDSQPGSSWDQLYLSPFFALVLQVLVLELLVRIVVALKAFWKSSK